MKVKRFVLSAITVVTIVSFFIFLSCRHDTILPDNIPEICFDKEVLPIFQNNCAIAGCHGGGGGGESNYTFTDYSGIKQAIVPFKPYKSPAYEAIIKSFGEGSMPPGRPLGIEDRTIIRLWILQGAGHTTCPDTTSPGYVNPLACFSRDILPVLVSSCALSNCHDAITHREGYDFSKYSTTLQAVVPGYPSESKLYTVIATTSSEDRMPPSPMSRLSDAAIDSIAKWISYGATNAYCGETCDTINSVTFSGVIWPAVQLYCTGCHNATTSSGGVRLDGYSYISSVASSGLLMNTLKGNGVTKMPPAGTLSKCKIRQFELWVNGGYQNN